MLLPNIQIVIIVSKKHFTEQSFHFFRCFLCKLHNTICRLDSAVIHQDGRSFNSIMEELRKRKGVCIRSEPSVLEPLHRMPLELFIVLAVVQSVDIFFVSVDQFMKVLPIHKLSSLSFVSYRYYSISCRNFNLYKHIAYISLVFISSLKHIERSFCQNIQFFI